MIEMGRKFDASKRLQDLWIKMHDGVFPGARIFTGGYRCYVKENITNDIKAKLQNPVVNAVRITACINIHRNGETGIG